VKLDPNENLLKNWRNLLSSRVESWKVRLQQVGTKNSMNALYAFFLGETAWPVLQSFYQGHTESTILLLSQIIGSVGANLISGQIEQWKDKGEIEYSDIKDNAELQKYLDILASKLGTLDILGNNLNEEDEVNFHNFLDAHTDSEAVKTYIGQYTNNSVTNVETINISNNHVVDNFVVILPADAESSTKNIQYKFPGIGGIDGIGDALTFSIKKAGQGGAFDDGRVIYFAYGDSELQYALYGVGDYLSDEKYYSAMEEALKLLLAFKPWNVPVVIAASSFVQSQLTHNLLIKYTCFTDPSDPHIYVLRREKDWKIYFDKRESRFHELRHIPRYLRNYDKTIRNGLSIFPVLNTDIYAGMECSKIWLEEIRKRSLYDPLNPNVDYQILSEYREELVEKETFTWESLRRKLVKNGFEPSKQWEFEGQRVLAQSYLQVKNDLVQLPAGIALNNELWVQVHDNFYTNTRLLRNILRLADIEDEFRTLPPEKLLSLLNNADFIEIKNRLSSAESTDAARKLAIALKPKFKIAMTAARCS